MIIDIIRGIINYGNAECKIRCIQMNSIIYNNLSKNKKGIQELNTKDITYYIYKGSKLDYHIIYEEPEPKYTGLFLRCVEQEEYISELWSVNGIDIDSQDIEGTLRKLWKRGGIPFALNNHYRKGGSIIYFAYPYWDWDSDEHMLKFKNETMLILGHMRDNFKEHTLYGRLLRYIEYETFCLNHSGTLNELFRDYYDKYLNNDAEQLNYDAYYAIYYYLVRLGYWYMDYRLRLTKKGKLYIIIDSDEETYIDSNISDVMYHNLDKFFHISLPVHPSPDEER